MRLEPAGAGRAVVTRAMRILVDRAVDERGGIHRVEWRASTSEPGINVARRPGMSCDGVLRETYAYRGVRQDVEVWSVLAPEWRAARARAARDDH